METQRFIPPPPPIPNAEPSTPGSSPLPPPPPPPVAMTAEQNNAPDYAQEVPQETGNGSVSSYMLGLLDSPEVKKVRKARSNRKEQMDDIDDENEEKDPNRPRQRRRSSRNIKEDRLYDGTQLHAGHHGYFVHRDYAAHFFRWGFASRWIKPGMRVLDIGSGQDLPLARVISAPNVYPNCKPEIVVCVDWNPIVRNFNPQWLSVHDQFDFCLNWPQLVGSLLQDNQTYVDIPEQHFDLITCFEVIEHMDLAAGDQLLQGAYGCLKPGGVFLLSTPVFDGSAAANHIHEYTVEELYHKLIANGWVLRARFGTFASLDVMKRNILPEHQQLVEQLSSYYGNDVLSCFLAPLYPDHSRNNTWVLQRAADFQQ